MRRDGPGGRNPDFSRDRCLSTEMADSPLSLLTHRYPNAATHPAYGGNMLCILFGGYCHAIFAIGLAPIGGCCFCCCGWNGDCCCCFFCDNASLSDIPWNKKISESLGDGRLPLPTRGASRFRDFRVVVELPRVEPRACELYTIWSGKKRKEKPVGIHLENSSLLYFPVSLNPVVESARDVSPRTTRYSDYSESRGHGTRKSKWPERDGNGTRLTAPRAAHFSLF